MKDPKDSRQRQQPEMEREEREESMALPQKALPADAKRPRLHFTDEDLAANNEMMENHSVGYHQINPINQRGSGDGE